MTSFFGAQLCNSCTSFRVSNKWLSSNHETCQNLFSVNHEYDWISTFIQTD